MKKDCILLSASAGYNLFMTFLVATASHFPTAFPPKVTIVIQWCQTAFVGLNNSYKPPEKVATATARAGPRPAVRNLRAARSFARRKYWDCGCRLMQSFSGQLMNLFAFFMSLMHYALRNPWYFLKTNVSVT